MKYLVAFTFVGLAFGDVYMHNPRGSNDRLNERSANRDNGDRLFDSQNNNRGGYNVGDQTDQAFTASDTSDEPGSFFNRELNKDQYSMVFFSGSKLGIEWTAQHGCGGNEETNPQDNNCNIVIQFTCNTNNQTQTDMALQVELKDGRNTLTPDRANTIDAIASTQASNDNNGRGRHESEAYYFECEKRIRNKGLFVADQLLNGETQKYTRQNPNGNRRGLECPEERDYYPYWNPSPWIDVAYLTDTVTDCTQGYNVLGNSMNVKQIGKCVYSGTVDADRAKAYASLNATTCANITSADWKTFSHQVAAPACALGEWSRPNHLGNGAHGQPVQYNWTVPEMNKLGLYTDTKQGQIAKCVVRLRYNISTDDYNPRTTDSKFNENKQKGIQSPIEENPTVDVGASLQGLRLAINTAQFGRTFQDRSHSFYIKPQPAALKSSCTSLENLNVRGKRGNIVQTFPAVEYDFQPNQLEISKGSCIHIQWTGSNSHNNGNPAGDGQAGDAGEGTGGTDRNNIVGLANRDLNYPIANDQSVHDQVSLFKNGNFDFWAPNIDSGYIRTSFSPMTAVDAAVYLASSSYYRNVSHARNMAMNTNSKLNELLNNAPASLPAGVVMKSNQAGMFHYMNTRNNNFSNRSQKGTLTVM